MAARILIIEDNATNLELVEYLLTRNGYQTLSAVNGEEGLRIACEQRPDLILCDLQMPVMNGYEVVRELKNDENLKQIPIVAVTASSMPGDAQKALDAGFNGYVSKPLEPEIFVQQIEGFLSDNVRARQ